MFRPSQVSLSDLLRTIAEHRSEAIALTWADQSLTYGDLNRRSNQLARYLREQSLPANALIGLYLDRSIDLIVAILGILKAGFAYVPLDPHYPSDRIQFIAQETQFPLLLSHSALSDRLPQLPHASVVCLDTSWGAIAQTAAAPLPDSDPDALAYVMYTSGSTGKPKGVAMPRANIARYITALHDPVPVQPTDVYLHVASFSFSSSVRQLFLPLYAGATVAIATREQTKNPVHLIHLMGRQRVTVFDGVPSIWRYALQLINDDAELRLRASRLSLRYLLLSGELTPCLLLQNLRQFFGDRVQVVNVYGQTETIGNTAYRVPTDFNQRQGYVPVGYPYPHNQAYILDAQGQPVPEGEVGNLYMAGGCLARGYYHRPDLTAMAFIDCPWTEEGDRIFNTGDLARRRPDGAIELLGRTDFQVKIRGMRVELDEIGAVLEQHPQVKAAAVAAHESPSGDSVLVGYVVPRAAGTGARWHADLRTYLGEQLPDYMVPGLFMTLEALPATPSGKLDRRNLPKPAVLSGIPVLESEAKTPMQQIFCQAFHVAQVDPEDSFISLGGHSLLYVQFSIELERHLGYVPADWEAMTVAELERQPQEHHSSPRIETNMVLRALAICGVVANHARLLPLPYVQGGALLLLFIAGLNFARFQSQNIIRGQQKPILTSLLGSLVIPYLAVETVFQLYTKDFHLSSFFLVSNFVGPDEMTFFLHVWFIQVFVQCVLILLALFSIHQLRRAIATHPWSVSLSLVGISGIIAYVAPSFWDTTDLYHRVPHMLLWLFLLGWTVYFTKTRLQRLAVNSLYVLAVLTLRDLIPSEMIWLITGGTLIIWQPYLTIPKALMRPVQIIGASSYYIYLTHIAFFSVINKIGLGSPPSYLVAGVLGGVLFWTGVQAVQQWLTRTKPSQAIAP
jgi:amino acid adenylation domain-containing protein